MADDIYRNHASRARDGNSRGLVVGDVQGVSRSKLRLSLPVVVAVGDILLYLVGYLGGGEARRRSLSTMEEEISIGERERDARKRDSFTQNGGVLFSLLVSLPVLNEMRVN